jgi:hypothetical protein
MYPESIIPYGAKLTDKISVDNMHNLSEFLSLCQTNQNCSVLCRSKPWLKPLIEFLILGIKPFSPFIKVSTCMHSAPSTRKSLFRNRLAIQINHRLQSWIRMAHQSLSNNLDAVAKMIANGIMFACVGK